MQKILRAIITLNLVILVILIALGLAGGSPPMLLRIAIWWWALSTIAILIIFLVLLTNRLRGKVRSARFWLDVVLFTVWLCAFGLILITLITGGAAFAAL
jgi:hypothetical protein